MDHSVKLLLVSLLKDKKDILFGKFSESITHEIKNKEWKAVLSDLNDKNVFVGKDFKYVRDVAWQNIRRSTMIYLKGQIERSINGQSGKPRRPNPYFMEMSFLRRVLKFDDVKNSESYSTKIENSKKPKLVGRSRSSSVLTDVDNVVLDIISSNKDSSSTIEIKDEIYSLASEEILPSEGEFEDESQQESRLPTITPPKNICEKRKYQACDDDDDEVEIEVDRDSRNRKVQDWRDHQKFEDGDDDEDLNSLKKTKLRLEIYNLQLEAMKKEIDLGLTRSELTAGLHKSWLLVPLKKEATK